MNGPLYPPPPETCPACDEPTAEHGWDAELQVCQACAEPFHEEDAARVDEESHGWDEEPDQQLTTIELTLHSSIYEGSVIGTATHEIPDVPAMNSDAGLGDAVAKLFGSDPRGVLITAAIKALGPRGAEFWPDPGSVIGHWQREDQATDPVPSEDNPE